MTVTALRDVTTPYDTYNLWFVVSLTTFILFVNEPVTYVTTVGAGAARLERIGGRPP